MLEKITDVPAGIDAFRVVGKLTRQDYEEVVEPTLEQAGREGRRLRLLVEMGPEYEGFTAGAAWGKTETWLEFPSLLRRIEGYAIVSDFGWVREWLHFGGFLSPFPLRVFGNDQRKDAIAWLSSLPEGPGVTHRLMPDSGVLVVEITDPLRAQDFDALGATADAWLATHDTLPGVVLHARSFPGWENISGLLRHVRFVRDHHRAVRRVALAADSRLADLLPHVAEHFVHAEIHHFGYDRLDEAIAWAAGHAAGHPSAADEASLVTVPASGSATKDALDAPGR